MSQWHEFEARIIKRDVSIHLTITVSEQQLDSEIPTGSYSVSELS